MSKNSKVKNDNDYIVEVKNLKKWFKKGKGIKGLLGGDVSYVKAIDGVSFSIKKEKSTDCDSA